uniref:Uncharacterized protein n=1 Tax=viral metagenome TaxID=1070528 RepID=A0A6C0LRF6_9ZZZZ
MSLLFSFEDVNTAYTPENALTSAKIPPTAVTFPSPRVMPYINNTAVMPIDIATSAYIRRPILCMRENYSYGKSLVVL